MPAISDSVHPDYCLNSVNAAIEWFDTNRRELPWRSPECSNWGILVSEIMLQQTPVVRVLPVWQNWLRLWPTPQQLATAETAEVLRAWNRLGYPRRALRLQACAQALVERHHNQVPETQAELRALPGVGEYTAAAVLSFALGQRATVVDVNVRRVQARCYSGLAHPAPTYSAAERVLAERLLPQDTGLSVRWNAAVMEIGALVCTARQARCEICPLQPTCTWFQSGRPENVAKPTTTQKWAGTDRQLRGAIMGHLRNADEPLPLQELRESAFASVTEDPSRATPHSAASKNVSHDSVGMSTPSGADQAWLDQFNRCLVGLLADGLCAPDGPAGERYRLP